MYPEWKSERLISGLCDSVCLSVCGKDFGSVRVKVLNCKASDFASVMYTDTSEPLSNNTMVRSCDLDCDLYSKYSHLDNKF